MATTSLPGAVPSVPNLNRSFIDRRAVTSLLLTIGAWLAVVIASVPLFSVLYMLITQGGARLGTALFTQLPPAGFMPGGGFGNAVLGTLVMVGIAAAISIPFGVLAATYLSYLSPHNRLSQVARFLAKVLTGFPSILAGAFGFAILVLSLGTYSSVAGGVALAVLMLPMVILTAEEAMRMVPTRMKEAAVGIGCTPTQVVGKVILPTALPGILTGIILGIARVAGEAAPLLFTALFSNFWLSSLFEPTASLSILIYNFSAMPFPNQLELAWAASLVLVLIVLFFNILSRLVGRPKV
jgi:phosphate transport system permease protein